MPPTEETKIKPALNRLVSLDAFRGFTIIAMLLVNNPGYDEAFPDQLRHAPWGHFVTFCDMIFPWFLFMVGVSLAFSAASFKKKGGSKTSYILKALRRCLLLVFFGILISCSMYKTLAIGIGGVLQLIGLAYLAGVFLYELPKKYRYYAAGGLLLLHWSFIRYAMVPGVGRGIFTEEVNIFEYINKTYLSHWHLAGLCSVIPTAALVLIGTMIGDLLREKEKEPLQKLKIILMAGAGLIFTGLFWHLDVMMNKAYWTPSYILFTAGTGCLMLGFFYWLIDIKGWQKWAFPLVVYGMNAITAYFVSIIIRIHTVQEWMTTNAAGEKITLWQAILDFWTGLAGMHLGSWLFTLSYIAFWWAVLYWMYRKKLFLRV